VTGNKIFVNWHFIAWHESLIYTENYAYGKAANFPKCLYEEYIFVNLKQARDMNALGVHAGILATADLELFDRTQLQKLHREEECVFTCVCECVCVCMRARECVCVCV
jgi:hypothetical protein